MDKIVKLVKLISGEEFLSEIVENTSTTLKCRNMIKFMATQQGLAMVPFNPLLKEQAVVSFLQNHVIFIEDVDERFVEEYAKAFSDIVTPSKRLIV